jgi:UDP-N-acetylglucosamine 2-epimerase (non-hydrolysing)
MKPLPLYLVAGARPNFIKLAPLVRSLSAYNELPFKVIHTGQHYDDALSASFFQTLGIPNPEINLDVGSGTHGAQTARILERFEALLLESPPCGVVVFGDVNSTLACAVAATKLHIPVVHVEAGLRSFDRSMPEEINRIVTDVLSDLLLVSEASGITNLEKEGIDSSKIHLVGNIMIDSLKRMLPTATERHTYKRFGLEAGNYGFLTLHRPSNVDKPQTLELLLHLFNDISKELPILFTVHPRTRARIEAQEAKLPELNSGFVWVDPLDYLDSLCLQKYAKVVMTDSGGIQEESTVLEVPCLTLRENTERPVTVSLGSSTLVGSDPKSITSNLQAILSGRYKKSQTIPLWDGHTADRITPILASHFQI